ncbi:MAG: 7-carboxy-7-deazaguanine synthase QueE [candidate division WOR-3 bacterium]
MNNLPVSEIFESIQGEGPFIGKRAVFLRLAFCNLKCSFCDTDYTWKGEIKYKRMSLKEVEEKILKYNINHLVITGGEPLLWEKFFFPLVENLLAKRFLIEVETNGTIESFLPQDVHFNVSPKLSNSGEPYEKRIKINVLKSFNKREKAIFKFVIEKEEDIYEVLDLKEKLNIENKKIYLMPESRNIKELIERKRTVFELSKKFGFKFSDRLHILMGVR